MGDLGFRFSLGFENIGNLAIAFNLSVDTDKLKRSSLVLLSNK
jgi:hypothetical protein